MQKFAFTDDFNNEIHEHIDSLFKRTNETSEQRAAASDRLIEDYFEHAGKIPPSSALERMGSYIMREDYEDRSPDKMTNTEYPTESEDQTKRRDRKFLPNPDTGTFSNNTDYGRRSRLAIDPITGEARPVFSPVNPHSVPNTTQKSPY